MYLVPASCARGVAAILVPPDTDPPWPDLAYLFLCRSLCRSLCHPCAKFKDTNPEKETALVPNILRGPCAEACPPEVPPSVGPSVFTLALAPARVRHKDGHKKRILAHPHIDFERM